MNKLVALFLVLNFFGSASFAQVQAFELQIVINAFKAEYQEELSRVHAKLLINNPPASGMTDFWWNLETVRAAYSTSYEGSARTHYILLMGGYARLSGMTVDGVVAAICHELGHGIAGAPFKDNQDGGAKISVEGQADYFAYNSCLPRMFKRLAGKQDVPLSNEGVKFCVVVAHERNDKSMYDYCLRAMQTLEVEKLYLWESTKTKVDIFNVDNNIAAKTDLGAAYYPGPQCRLNTMIAGIANWPRPSCWFKKE